MYHIIANPIASSGKSKRALKKVENYLKENKIPYLVHFTEYAGHATVLAGELTKAGEREIIAFGGDGTMHEVFNGLEDPSKVHFGIIPAGTGNDFAGFVGLPLHPVKAIETIVKGEAKPADYILCGGVRSLNSVGVGIDVDVLQRCQGSSIPGKLRYWKCLLDALHNFKGYHFKATADGKTKDYHAFLAVLCNGGMFGGGFRICPSADVADGRLNLIIVDYLKGFKRLKALLALVKGNIEQLEATTSLSVEQVEITPKHPFILQFDGELYGGVPFHAEVKRGGMFLYR